MVRAVRAAYGVRCLGPSVQRIGAAALAAGVPILKDAQEPRKQALRVRPSAGFPDGRRVAGPVRAGAQGGAVGEADDEPLLADATGAAEWLRGARDLARLVAMTGTGSRRSSNPVPSQTARRRRISSSLMSGGGAPGIRGGRMRAIGEAAISSSSASYLKYCCSDR